MKKTNLNIPLPEKESKESLQVEVDGKLFEAAENARNKVGINKRGMVEHGLKLFIAQVDPETALKLGYAKP